MFILAQLRHRLVNNFKIITPKKQKLPQQMLGQDNSKPVVPPGLTLMRPLKAYYHMQAIVYEVLSPVAHTLKNHFCLPSEAHSEQYSHIALTPPATRFDVA